MAILSRERQRAAIVEGGRILSAALDAVAAAVRPGVSGLELDTIAERFIRRAGAEPAFKGYRGFPAALCVSVNDAVVHGIPTADRKLRDGDIVGLDLGLRWRGLITDCAVTVGVGTLQPSARRLILVAYEALQRGVAAVRAGATTGDVGAAIQAFVEGAGYQVVRDLVGHGVGLKLHEEPELPNFGRAGSGPRLVRDQVIALEPMITAGQAAVASDTDGWTIRTADHSLAAHFEQTLLVTETGATVLTPYGQHSQP